MIFCAVVSKVEISCGPEVSELFCGYLKQSQWDSISMDLVLRGMMVSLVTPTDVEL